MSMMRLQQKREVIDLTRSFFSMRGFFEMETPLLVPSPGMEVHLHGFKTDYEDHQGRQTPMFLPTSPEFGLKKALGRGWKQVFEISRVFRNKGELSKTHHPEFNMLEWYRPGDYVSIMEDVDAYLKHLADHFSGLVSEAGYRWDAGTQRTTICECFLRHAGLDLVRGLSDAEYWLQAARACLGEHIPDHEGFEDIFFRVWLKNIEPNLGREKPEIVYDYPASMAALAKIKAEDQRWAERFEVYIQGLEIGNAFSELIDPAEQRERFHAANRERSALGYPPHPVDEALLQALGKMEATGGIAVGIERLLMALTGENDIREFFLYPVGDTKRR